MQRETIRYSTAINLSDRFPLVSPAGCFFRIGPTGNERRHFVDGGYYENKGSETLLEVIRALNLRKVKVKPYVLQFNFGGDTTVQSVTKFNEIMEIVDGIYNTRSGRGRIAQEQLENLVDSLHGVFIPLTPSLNNDELPMNWVLSRGTINKVDSTISAFVNRDRPISAPRPLLSDTAHNELRRLFFYSDSAVRVRKSHAIKAGS